MFIFGLSLGSFLNVCIYRIPEKKSIMFPGSYCPACNNSLKWYHNVPIVSYLVIRGKCVYCNDKISLRYPIIELLTGLLFVIFFLKFGLVKIYFFYIIIVGYMIVLSFIDYDRKIVPDIIVVFMLLTGLLFNAQEYGNINIFQGIIGALYGGMIIYFLNFFSNGKIGEGDIKLITALGFLMGSAAILDIIVYSFIIGGIVSVLLIVIKKYKRTDEVAFVPFIAIAFLIRGLLLT